MELQENSDKHIYQCYQCGADVERSVRWHTAQRFRCIDCKLKNMRDYKKKHKPKIYTKGL